MWIYCWFGRHFLKKLLAAGEEKYDRMDTLVGYLALLMLEPLKRPIVNGTESALINILKEFCRTDTVETDHDLNKFILYNLQYDQRLRT